MQKFPQAPVTVTLTGTEWTTIMARLAVGERSLSRTGRAIYRDAARKLADQVVAASDACHAGIKRGPRLVSPPPPPTPVRLR